MRVRNVLCAVAVVVLAISARVNAETMSYVGAVTGDETLRWRTSTVNKSMDIDGDNVYGTWGAINFADALVGNMIYVSSGSQYGHNGVYAAIDNLASTGGAGIALSSYTFTLGGNEADYVGKTVRIGVMTDVLSSAEWDGNYGHVYTLAGPDGVSAASPAAPASDGVPDMFFFDVAGATAGQTYTITSTGGASTPYLSAVSVDIGTVPEPSTFAMLTAWLVGLLAYAWRRRK